MFNVVRGWLVATLVIAMSPVLVACGTAPSCADTTQLSYTPATAEELGGQPNVPLYPVRIRLHDHVSEAVIVNQGNSLVEGWPTDQRDVVFYLPAGDHGIVGEGGDGACSTPFTVYQK